MPSAFWSDVCFFVCSLKCFPIHDRGSTQADCRCLQTYLMLEGYDFLLCPAGQEVLSSLGSKREKYSNIQNNALTNQIHHEETEHLCSGKKKMYFKSIPASSFPRSYVWHQHSALGIEIRHGNRKGGKGLGEQHRICQLYT